MPEQIVRRCIECEGLIRAADDWVVDGMLMRHTWCPASERTRFFRSLEAESVGSACSICDQFAAARKAARQVEVGPDRDVLMWVVGFGLGCHRRWHDRESGDSHA